MYNLNFHLKSKQWFMDGPFKGWRQSSIYQSRFLSAKLHHTLYPTEVHKFTCFFPSKMTWHELRTCSVIFTLLFSAFPACLIRFLAWDLDPSGVNRHCFGGQHYLHRLHSTWLHNNSNRDDNLSNLTLILGRVNIYKHPVKLCITNLLNIRRAALFKPVWRWHNPLYQKAENLPETILFRV